MANDEDDGGDVESVAQMGSQILAVLDAEAVIVNLHNGKVVEGSLANFSLRKRSKKGSVSWNGKLSVEIDTGVLDMDIANVKSVRSK
jgi:hypothetical protein